MHWLCGRFEVVGLPKPQSRGAPLGRYQGVPLIMNQVRKTEEAVRYSGGGERKRDPLRADSIPFN